MRDQIAKISPKEKRKSATQSTIDQLIKDSEKLLAKFESETAKDLRRLKRAVKRVGKRLEGKVRVEI